MKSLSLILVSLVLLTSCGQDGIENDSNGNVTINKGQSTQILHILFQSMTSFEAQVFYENGAEPYTGNTSGGRPIWGFFEKNLSSAIKASDRGVALVVPKTIGEMTSMGSKGKSTWSANEIVDLSKAYGEDSSSAKGALKVFFLKGTFADESGSKPGVLGVHITNTMTVAIFKDNIDSIRSSQGLAVARFSEQSVLIHELGHALGLVDNGVTPQSAHHDSANGAHCSNKSCVMYFQNEGSNDLVEFIRSYVISGDEDLFGSQCLQDLHSLIN